MVRNQDEYIYARHVSVVRSSQDMYISEDIIECAIGIVSNRLEAIYQMPFSFLLFKL